MATNYLIGRGELLVDSKEPPAMKPSKAHPYTVDEARNRLSPQLESAILEISESEVAPDDVYVAKFALHPSYVAKSYFPSVLFQAAGLEPVGSRGRKIQPEKHTGKDADGKEFGTSEIFVAGRLEAFQALHDLMVDPSELPERYAQIREIEEITSFQPEEKVKAGTGSGPDATFELVVHLPSANLAPSNRLAFLEYARNLGFNVREDLSFEVQGLWFLPAIGPSEQLDAIAAFSTVRVVRPMPLLSVQPAPRTMTGDLPITLPTGQVQSTAPRVAILDGGLPAEHAIGPWVDLYREMDPSATSSPGYEQHGLAVASAFLFGGIRPGTTPAIPPSNVSVFRVLDGSTASDDSFELYRTLGHVEEVLLTKSFEFINLSLGPALPIEDDEVHAWTALIDDLLSDGATLMTVAVGNNGRLDHASGNARVQVPGDCVNALAVGAADRADVDWERAEYSAIGPGRAPGVVKPDLLAHGGSSADPFYVIGEGEVPYISGVTGTSLAAPLALRHAVSIRSLLGTELSPLAIRALLIHGADQKDLDRREVGWGRIPMLYDEIVTTGDGVARVVYQGVVNPGKYIRAHIPTPKGGLDGRVQFHATFCFASAVDTHSPDVYTRAGLEIVYRPDTEKFKKDAKTAKSASFFSPTAFATEDELRSDNGKWETVLKGSKSTLGSSAANPVFDIHYVAREEGGASKAKEPMRYALVITVEAKNHVDLHNEILDAYPDLLVAIEPEINIEVDGA
ncbi:S8 family peptidase [Herbiconiux sp. 11R-BC]|uniref:S8 family peptidase n=1 Tax=Herbiconiux sp. 11R-BC TaxID=3111637 RepID=UPI003C051005